MNVAELFGLLGIQTDFQSVAKALGALSQLRQATEAATNTAQLSAALKHVHGDAKQAAALIGVSYDELAMKKERAAKRAAAWGKAVQAASSIARTAIYGVGVAIGAIYSLNRLGSIGDEYTGAASKIRGLTDDVEQQKRLQDQLFESAQRTATGYGDVASLYQQVAKAAQPMGRSLEQSAVLVDTINKAIKSGGGSAEGSKAALTQLAQALGSGKLRGEEFNSVIEQAPFLIDVIAKSLGKTRGEMRKMAEGGLLTSKVVIKALESQRGAIDEAFAKRIPQVSDMFVRLRNTVSKELSKVFQDKDVAEGLVSVFRGLTSVLVTLIQVLGTVGAFFARHPDLFATVAIFVAALTGAFIGLKIAALQAALAEAAAAAPFLGLYVLIGAIVLGVIALGVVFRKHLGKAAEWVGDRVKDLGRLVLGFFRAIINAPAAFAGAVRDVFNAVFNWIADKLEWAWKRVKEVAQKAKDYIVDAPAQFVAGAVESTGLSGVARSLGLGGVAADFMRSRGMLPQAAASPGGAGTGAQNVNQTANVTINAPGADPAAIEAAAMKGTKAALDERARGTMATTSRKR